MCTALGVIRIASAIVSRSSSSSVRNRMHDFPMSSFLPAAAYRARMNSSTDCSEYAHIR